MKLVLFISLFAFSLGCGARQLTVLDQQGQPVADLVVSYPATPAYQPTDSLAVMDQINKQFSPHVLIIQAGQQVIFPNSDDIRHHVYSFSPTKPFELKLYAGSDAPPMQFDTPGVVVLGCNIHDGMIGYIYVNDGRGTALSNSQGELNIPAEVTALSLWHPRQQLSVAERTSITLAPGQQQIILPFSLVPPAEPSSKGTKFGRKLRPQGQP